MLMPFPTVSDSGMRFPAPVGLATSNMSDSSLKLDAATQVRSTEQCRARCLNPLQKELQAFIAQETAQVPFPGVSHDRISPCPAQSKREHPPIHKNVLGQVSRPSPLPFHRLSVSRCISNVTSGRLAPAESSCLTNCVGRFLDASLHLVNDVESKRQQINAA